MTWTSVTFVTSNVKTMEEEAMSEKEAKKKIDFDNTEDALDQVGASLARHSFEKNIKRGSKAKKKL